MDQTTAKIRSATHEDLRIVQNFLQPFMDSLQLLQRTSIEMELLLKHAFIATEVVESVDVDSSTAGSIVGFAALEIYSKKLAEIQCLAVSEKFRRRGIGRDLVQACLERARDEKVRELMAISSSEDMFKACGFDYALPNQKRAFFVSPLGDDEHGPHTGNG